MRYYRSPRGVRSMRFRRKIRYFNRRIRRLKRR